VLVMNEKFKITSQIYPSKIQVLGSVQKSADIINREAAQANSNTNAAQANALGAMRRINVYDIVYLSGRDLYAFCSSDHAIAVCKEQVSMGGTKTTYLHHNKVYHSMLHLKLCWCKSNSLLCSVASDKTIYGWDIDKQLPLFQISRHSDIITDFICVENLEAFITSSMDTTIVMWSATSRRVKGLFSGHKRGVRSLSQYDNILLSTGFEAEGRTWDIASKEPLGILRGHRHSIATSKLMCDRAESEKDYRAITVDEYGEFRLWDMYIKEKTSEAAIYPTLQVFQMQNPEIPLNMIRFIALPNNPVHSTSYYSDMIAVATKLLHFLPEKNAKDFMAPTCCVFNDPSAALMTAVGRNLVKYDITNGHYICTLHEVHTSDITTICLDGERGRRLFAGCLNGDILLVNFLTGVIIDSFSTHNKEILCIASHTDTHGNKVYAGTACGKIKELEESTGNLRLHNQIESPFGDGVGVATIKIVPSLKIFIASAVGKSWGIWMESTLKRVLVMDEIGVVNAIEVIGASGDKEDVEFWDRVLTAHTPRTHSAPRPGSSHPGTPGPGNGDNDPNNTAAKKSCKKGEMPVDHLLTVAVAMSNTTCVRVYTIDIRAGKGCLSFELTHNLQALNLNNPLPSFLTASSIAGASGQSSSVYFTTMCVLRAPEGCVNYAMNRPTPLVIGVQLIAVTDDGQIIIWDANKLRRRSEFMYRLRRYGIIKHGQQQLQTLSLLNPRHTTTQGHGHGHHQHHHHHHGRGGEKQQEVDPYEGLNLDGFNSEGAFIGLPVVEEPVVDHKPGSPIHSKHPDNNKPSKETAKETARDTGGDTDRDKQKDKDSAGGVGEGDTTPHEHKDSNEQKDTKDQQNADEPKPMTSAAALLITETSAKRPPPSPTRGPRASNHPPRHNKTRRKSKEDDPICTSNVRTVPRSRTWIGMLIICLR
jgi:WD40 repeat protein